MGATEVSEEESIAQRKRNFLRAPRPALVLQFLSQLDDLEYVRVRVDGWVGGWVGVRRCVVLGERAQEYGSIGTKE